MDNQNNQQPDNQVHESPKQPVGLTERPMVSPAQSSNSATRSRLKPFVFAALGLLLVALIPVAYLLGKQQASNPSQSNVSEQVSASDINPADGTEEAETKPADDSDDEYSGWNTFENVVYSYSFKYPSDWRAEQNADYKPGVWVDIDPADHTETSNGSAAISIFTYADGTGCPAYVKKDFSIGGYSVEGSACTGTELYKVGMKHSKVVGQRGSNTVILARTAPDSIVVQINMGSSADKDTVQLILDSITGLTPTDD